MRCHEVRNLVGPYLDSELDTKTSCEIERHFEACSECASVFEAEQALDNRIFNTLRSGPRDGTLWEQVEKRLTQAPPRQPRLRLKWLRTLAPLAAAAALVALLAFVLWPGQGPPDLARAVAQDHAEFVEGAMRPQFTGQPPAELLRQTGGRLDALAFSQLPQAAGFRAEGGRLCHLDGVPVAWVIARWDGLPVSVVVMRREELRHFPELLGRLRSGHPVVCARAGRYHFAARYVGEHVVCAMADLPMKHLEELVQSVAAEG